MDDQCYVCFYTWFKGIFLYIAIILLLFFFIIFMLWSLWMLPQIFCKNNILQFLFHMSDCNYMPWYVLEHGLYLSTSSTAELQLLMTMPEQRGWEVKAHWQVFLKHQNVISFSESSILEEKKWTNGWDDNKYSQTDWRQELWPNHFYPLCSTAGSCIVQFVSWQDELWDVFSFAVWRGAGEERWRASLLRQSLENVSLNTPGK